MGTANDWIWLHIPCPVDGCTNKEITYWSHRNCPKSQYDHDVKLNSDGYIKCNACEVKGPIIDWRFDCGCGHGLKNATTNIFKLNEMIGIINKATNDTKFCAKLMKNISEMYS